jgi:hypothetical protein
MSDHHPAPLADVLTVLRAVVDREHWLDCAGDLPDWCGFCYRNQYTAEPDHESDCVVLLAQDMLTGYEEKADA